jgi:transcriptional regulator of NAD metabolism
MAASEGERRREDLLRRLQRAPAPVTGDRLARACGVSRQAIARDVAVLRAAGHPIVATRRGYTLAGDGRARRVLKVRHSRDQLSVELHAIVDLGGWVEDVSVNHRVYGRMTGRLDIRSRLDIDRFLADLESGRSMPLMAVTGGYHFHTVSAADEQTLAEIEQALSALGFLAPRLPYEEDPADTFRATRPNQL